MRKMTSPVNFFAVLMFNNANPNGDSIDGNRPRMNADGYGQITATCIKRKICNELQEMGEPILKISSDRLSDEDIANNIVNLKSRYEQAEKEIRKELGNKNVDALSQGEFSKLFYDKWIDLRAFGDVPSFKNDSKNNKNGEGDEETKKGSKKAAKLSVQASRAAVTIDMIESINKINVVSHGITSSYNREDELDSKEASSMGRYNVIEHGVYVIKGTINARWAEKNHFSVEDSEKIKEAIWNMFNTDASAARPAGSSEVVHLVWLDQSKLTTDEAPALRGKYNPAEVNRAFSAKIKEGVDIPKNIDDYEFTFTRLPGLADPEIRTAFGLETVKLFDS